MTSDTPSPAVRLETEGKVSIVTLNRPHRRNAIDFDTNYLLAATLKQADVDPATRVIVLTGEGVGFCAGGDVKNMVGSTSFGPADRPYVYTPGRDLIKAFLRLEKPIIAMVNGAAAGLGATIALMSDIVVMADEAIIGDVHVKVGLAAGDGGAAIWPLLIGPSRAKEFLLTGRMLRGEEAERIGLISASVPLSGLRQHVMELAEEMAALPPYAVMATKSAINRALEVAVTNVLDTSLAYEHLSMATKDHQRALEARATGVPAEYDGR
ncbi:enoyl-CoA hydratase/isomerase family protein [Aeromicrobium chenweiae]|uniref:Enoyl-CoA hydratase n=1 Tax=Aeromicrobium chenweiae TaxID=2079793 RepID=A0A2S0WPG5_9ACTN|nr:enoyl-CoA hydratase/isomerase family protein [Aeromicrobium chenweiae]AWB93239.1 enoyl-CoA hydratase [Aeromicrobium chenweiae]TGN34232.1 enoyl-CoA hydratase/isomerase family protein [Aeromicrobium chenweiae]